MFGINKYVKELTQLKTLMESMIRIEEDVYGYLSDEAVSNMVEAELNLIVEDPTAYYEGEIPRHYLDTVARRIHKLNNRNFEKLTKDINLMQEVEKNFMPDDEGSGGSYLEFETVVSAIKNIVTKGQKTISNESKPANGWMEKVDMDSLEIEGGYDEPCLVYAEFENGQPLSDSRLDDFAQHYAEEIYEIHLEHGRDSAEAAWDASRGH